MRRRARRSWTGARRFASARSIREPPSAMWTARSSASNSFELGRVERGLGTQDDSDLAGIAVHLYPRAVADRGRRDVASDAGGQSILARDDGGVAEDPAGIGHEGARRREQRR